MTNKKIEINSFDNKQLSGEKLTFKDYSMMLIRQYLLFNNYISKYNLSSASKNKNIFSLLMSLLIDIYLS